MTVAFGMHARLIPRSLFFQSELYHRLNQTDGSDAGLLGNANLSWRDPAKENEDALHLVINAGGLWTVTGDPRTPIRWMEGREPDMEFADFGG